MKAKHIVLAACLSTASLLFNAMSFSQVFTKNNKNMKTFAVLVKVPVTYTAEQAKAVNPVWEKTINHWKEEGVYITSFAFPATGIILEGVGKKEMHTAEVVNGRRIVSCILFKTETIEQATELAKACPVLDYDGAVEVREIPAGIPQIY